MSETRPLAMVTGASSGIGFELAMLLADDGYDLIVAADDEAIYPAADKLGTECATVQAVQVDLRKPADVERLYRSSSGRVPDVVVLNAGSVRAGSFVEGDLDADLSIIDLNVRSTVHLAKRVLRDMTAKGSGKVLFTSSIVAAMPGSLQSIYNASKSFIQSLAEALQDELRDTDVTVTALMPGPTDTNLFARNHMENTVLARWIPKDDPAQVAKQGYDAMMNGRRRVVASSISSKALGLINTVLPDMVKAKLNRFIASPVRGN
ncbi:SDR family NAD(P)-dependent oxidoreductase [Mycolicibacterium smegmatis]|nr:SDR family NAD(P)-dependent oxidoreductase [Mycolicibacterium smegmatis]